MHKANLRIRLRRPLGDDARSTRRAERVEFDMLAALARRPGAAITRRWLAENVLDPERDGRRADPRRARLAAAQKSVCPASIETVGASGTGCQSRTADELRLRLALTTIAVAVPLGAGLMWFSR